MHMAPRTEQQFEEIRESKKKLILETALELFASEGFHTTPISRIASEAGISKGLLYNYALIDPYANQLPEVILDPAHNCFVRK